MQCSLSAPGENRTQFVAMADGDLSTAATSTTHVEALADLKLELRDPQGPIAVGDDTVYEVHVKNRGTKPAEGHKWVETGPHVMVVGAPSLNSLYPSGPEPDTTKPYVMFPDTPYAHVMIPVS